MEATIVFDMDGVLIDSERLLRTCLFQVVPQRYDRARLTRAFNDTLGVTIEETGIVMRRWMGEDFPVDEIFAAAAKLYFAEVARAGVPEKPGARALLAFCKERGYQIGLASSSARPLVEQELGMLGLLPYFDVTVTGDDIENSKPAPDIYLRACEKLSVRPEDAYAVEDSFCGIKSAHAAGMRVLGVPDILPFPDEIGSLCHKTFDTLFSVKDWLEACE